MDDPVKIRLLLVDDHFLIRLGLVSSFEAEPDMIVVGQASSGPEAISVFAEVQPDVTLMDGRLPGMMGVEAVEAIVARNPEARIIMFTINETEEHIHRALEAGVRAYLPKSTGREELLYAVRLVHRGSTYQPASVRAKITVRRQRIPLSHQEFQVLQLIAIGRADSEIAEKLTLSQTTLRTEVRSLLFKLGVSDRTSAVSIGLERGLVEIE